MSTRNRFGAIIGAGVLAATLAACSGGTPGAAAVIDGRTVAQSQVDSVIEQLNPAFSGQLEPTGVTMNLAYEPVLSAVAKDHDLAFTDSQLVDLYTSTAASVGVDPVEDLSSASFAFLRYQAISAAYQSLSAADANAFVTEANAELAAVDITVNPRYLSATDTGFAPTTYPWIVQAADATAITTQ